MAHKKGVVQRMVEIQTHKGVKRFGGEKYELEIFYFVKGK
jgi:hypothetical protein